MAWTTPKTDWVATDYINATDFNRWKNNLLFLYDTACLAYPTFHIDDMGDDKTYSDFPYASDINKIELNLYRIAKTVGISGFDEYRTYYQNQSTIDYAEINRIETTMNVLYNKINGVINGIPRLSFNLNRPTIGNRGI